jgi:succinyl-diaminopimelate desuccinylase
VDELLNLVAEMVRIPSVNPPGGSELRRASSFVLNWLKERGVEAREVEFNQGWPLVLAEIGEGHKRVMLNGHFDVVPPGDLTMWSFDPFSGAIQEDRILGRGASDMKAGLAVFMKVITEVEPGECTLTLAAVPDEEVGGRNGSRILAERANYDLVLISEPTGSGQIAVGEKGLLQVKLIRRGKTAHGSLPSLGENAILNLAKDLVSLSKVSEISFPTPPDLSGALINSINIIGPDVGKISYNPGVIRGGVKLNVVPDYAEAEVDMRIPPGVSVEEGIRVVKSLVGAQVIPLDLSEPNYTSGNAVNLLGDVIRKVLGVEPKEYIFTGATDGRFFRFKGIPTLVYGPGVLGKAHSYDEYITLDELRRVYRVYKEFLREFCA